MTRIKRDAIAYLLIVVFCIVMLAWAIPTYSPAYPGYGASPALVPIVAVCIMLFMTCISLIFVGMAVFMHKPLPAEEREFPEDLKDDAGFTQVGRIDIKHLAKIMLPCMFLVATIDFIGYIPAALIFLAMFQYAVGCRRWTQLIVVSVVLTAVLFIIMRYGFSVPVPGPHFF